MGKYFKPKRSGTNSKLSIIFKDRPFDVPVTRTTRTYTQDDFFTRIGKWLEFTTRWGTHRGMIEDVKNDSVLVKIPTKSVPNAWINYAKPTHSDFQLAGFDGCHPDGCHPHGCFRQGAWFWCWIPIIAILFIFPFFCW